MHKSTKIPVIKGRCDGKAIRVDCPYCGQVHIHGRNIEAYPAHRVSHCHQEKATLGYMVTVD
ncbi:hypothetical protein ACFLV6_00055 [Chloroflexota bacterium]